MESGLDKIIIIQGVEYNTIGDDPENDCQIGFIAKEMEEVAPEIVSTDSDGYKGIANAKNRGFFIEFKMIYNLSSILKQAGLEEK